MALSPHPPLPVPFRLVNALGRLLGADSSGPGLDEEAVCRVAMRRTGLTDFGDPDFRDGLREVLASAARDARLTFLGRVAFRDWVVKNLVNRLLFAEARKRSPQRFTRPLIPPIIILGLPRSGTTLLHRLLALDPAHRGVPLWELLRPFPAGRPDWRRLDVAWRAGLQRALTPELDRKHFVRPDSPEECIWIQSLTFVSVSFWVLAPVYGYLEWYSERDRRAAYREYRLLLDVLQATDPERRLVLKAPAHTGALGILGETVPDALLIQTHRDPVVACTSLNSLTYSTHASVSDALDVHRMAEANVGFLARELGRNLAARDAAPAVHDVHYEELIRDPVGTVKRIYTRFGLEWSEAYEARLLAYLREHPREEHGRHTYRARDFGQTEAAIAERFAAYSERFGLGVSR